MELVDAKPAVARATVQAIADDLHRDPIGFFTTHFDQAPGR
ncbi:hypothetical protein [Dactylosporangium sp. CA-152071]